MPGFDANAPPLAGFDEGVPQPLPDALRGERWNFVKLPLESVLEEANAVRDKKAFGAIFDLEKANLKVSPSTVRFIFYFFIDNRLLNS